MDKAKILEIASGCKLKKLAIEVYHNSENPVEIIDSDEFNVSDDIVTIVNAVLAAGQAASTAPTPWISVTHRLPTEHDEVLVYRPDAHHSPACDHNINIREYFGNGKFAGAHEVTHWMPLPAAPDFRATTGPEKGGEPK